MYKDDIFETCKIEIKNQNFWDFLKTILWLEMKALNIQCVRFFISFRIENLPVEKQALIANVNVDVAQT